MASGGRRAAHGPDRELASDPVVFGKRRAVRGLQHQVRAVPRSLDIDVCERGRGHDMQRRVVDEVRAGRALADLEQLVGNLSGFAEREHVLRIRACDRCSVRARRNDAHGAVEQRGEHRVGVLVGGEGRVVGQRDLRRAAVPARAQSQERAPRSRVLRTRHAARFGVHQRERAVTDEPARRDLDGVQRFAEHRLHGVAIQRGDGSWLRHASP